MWEALLIAFAVTVAIGDVRWRRIPRALTMSALVAGLAYHALYGGFLSALLAAALGLAAGFVLFALRAIGGGDVKLIAAAGALLGMERWLLAMFVALLAAGLMALAAVLVRRRLMETVSNIAALCGHWLRHGLRPHPEIRVENGSLVRIPFGLAAAAAIIVVVMAVPA